MAKDPKESTCNWIWPCTSHSDIFNTSYGWMKDRESNWQFDSRPLKVTNWLDPGACRWSATHYWKALDKSYKFALDLIPIKGLGKELWCCKVPESKSGQFRDFSFGVPGQKAFWMEVPWRGIENTIWGKVVASPESGPWWIKWVRVTHGLS
jgi:hypothetical protein